MSKKCLIGLVIGLAAFGLTAPASRTQTFRILELKSQDIKFQIRGFRTAHARVFLAGIDDQAVQVLGRWPWPRSYHAAFLEVLSRRPPAAVGFDVLFHQPDDVNPGADEALMQLSRLFDALTFAAYFREDNEPQAAEPWMRAVLDRLALPRLKEHRAGLREAAELTLPMRPLAETSAVGFVNAPRDADGAVRKVPLIFKYGPDVYPAFALRLVMQDLGVAPGDVHRSAGGNLELRLKDRTIEIPIDANGDFRVNFRSGLTDFTSRNFAAMLKDPGVPDESIVVVGLTATGAADTAPTPVDAHTPLVLVHLNALQNILQDDFLHGLAPWAETLILFVCCAVTGILSYGAAKIWAAFGTAAFLGGFLIANIASFVYAGRLWAVLTPVFGISLTYLVSTTLRYWLEEGEKRWIKRAFQRYLSPAVLNQVLSDPKALDLGGKREELTVLFSDIRQFTAYSERHSPEEVVRMLNEYFDAMTQIVFNYGGTLDKYIGDGLMAIFGAPVPLNDDHAISAVRAAKTMQSKVRELSDRWAREGREPIAIGVGINTGPMVVGNMGSSRLVSYTVVGDEVNLAARLEGLTRQYDCDIVVSGSTYERIRNILGGRYLGEVKVKGRQTQVHIYAVDVP